ncbi:MAG: hypothetical protein WBC33_11305 [Conexibacter sp.]
MDPFLVIIVGGLALLLVAVVLLGLFYPGSGAEQLDWKSPRALAEREAALDSDDLAQMLDGLNRRRRARGVRELTLDEVQAHRSPRGD